MLFVFTNFYSIKSLKIKFGLQDTKKNVFFDSDNLFFNTGSSRNIYPFVLYLEKGLLLSGSSFAEFERMFQTETTHIN